MNNIVFLDAFTTNPGDVDFSLLESLAHFTAFDRTNFEDLNSRGKEANIVIVNKFPINEETLNFLPKVQYICVAATGYNNIDIEAVRYKNIQVSNVRNYSTDAVAQHVFASILAFYNRTEYYNNQVKSGKWADQDDFCFFDHSIPSLYQKTLGIAGYGAIGQKVCAIAIAFGMKVIVYSRSKIEAVENIEQVDKDRLFAESDILTLHMPLTDETRHFINKEVILKMKSTAVIINTARGPLLEEDSVLHALDNQKLGGILLDVLNEEPPKNPHLLIFHPKCFVTPHIAWAGLDARRQLIRGIYQNISAFLAGNWINPIYGQNQ
ncbi:MAG: D-2-hydroxyacid dehydrogenase [Saprospiraceae bacterium]